MNGDFSRWTFNPANHFTRVLMQQGRVQLDTDWNEQVAILLHTMRQMVSDMMGPHGTWDEAAFEVRNTEGKYEVNQKGRYYAEGVLVDTATGSDNWQEIDGADHNKLIYLDVWERHLTYVEADEDHTPGLREVALKGADTTTRARVVWGIDDHTLSSTEVNPVKTARDTLTNEYSQLEILKKNLAAEITNLKNLASLSIEFEAFKSIFDSLEAFRTTINQVIEPINKDTSRLNLTPSSDYNDSELERIIGRLNELIARFQLSPKIEPLPEESVEDNDSDQKVIDLISRLNQLTTVMQAIENYKQKIDISKQNLADFQQDFVSKMRDFEKEQTDKLQMLSSGKLKAWTNSNDPTSDTDSCTIPPDAAYTGPENQLYRVEIHQGGSSTDATFKWSRDNGIAIFPVDPKSIVVSGQELTLNVANLGRDTEVGLAVEDWVELTYDDLVETLTPGRMFEVTKVDTITGTITLKATAEPKLESPEDPKHPILRRWDQGSNAIQVKVKDGDYLHNLENGIHIEFDSSGTYRTGDYWLIPARTASRDIEWPADEQGNSKTIPPHGIEHHYAPLAIITTDGTIIDCRRVFEHLGQPVLPKPEPASESAGQ